jgi:hypothetical protein
MKDPEPFGVIPPEPVPPPKPKDPEVKYARTKSDVRREDNFKAEEASEAYIQGLLKEESEEAQSP